MTKNQQQINQIWAAKLWRVQLKVKYTEWYTTITFNSNRSTNISVPTHLLILSLFIIPSHARVKKGRKDENLRERERLATMRYSNEFKKETQCKRKSA